MNRIALAGVVVFGTVIGCRPYDLRSPLTDDRGLVPAARFARFGTEQAVVVAIGRSLAQWDGGQAPAARADQVTRAAQYALTLPGVKSVVADTLGYRLTVTLASGWRATVLPVADGVKPEDTRGIPR